MQEGGTINGTRSDDRSPEKRSETIPEAVGLCGLCFVLFFQEIILFNDSHYIIVAVLVSSPLRNVGMAL